MAARQAIEPLKTVQIQTGGQVYRGCYRGASFGSFVSVLVLTQLRYAAHGVSYVVVSSENNCHCDGWDWG